MRLGYLGEDIVVKASLPRWQISEVMVETQKCFYATEEATRQKYLMLPE